MSTRSRSGSFFLIFIGALLSVAGGLFVVLMWGSFTSAMEMRSWPEVEVQMLKSEVEERQLGPAVPREYAASVLFGYVYEDKAWTSDRIDYRGDKWSKDPGKAKEQVDSYPVGTLQVAWVDPENPEFAVLKLPTKAAIYSIWFPALFFVGGLGMMLAALRKLAGA